MPKFIAWSFILALIAGCVSQGTGPAKTKPNEQLASPTTRKTHSPSQINAPANPPASQATESADLSRDIVELLRQKTIEIEAQGSGIQTVSLRLRRLVASPVEVMIAVGTFFVSRNSSVQNMVATEAETIVLQDSDWVTVSISAACANRPRNIPESGDGFQVQRSPNRRELAALMPILDKANVSYPTRQAAVWIVTDNATYADLGILISRPAYSAFGGTRTIGETEAAQAIRICDEAGINITRKRIWRDVGIILSGLTDEDLKNWLLQKAARPAK